MNKPREPKRRCWRHWRPRKGPGSYRVFLRNRPTPVRWRISPKRNVVTCCVMDRQEYGAIHKGAKKLVFHRFSPSWRMQLKRHRNKARLWR